MLDSRRTAAEHTFRIEITSRATPDATGRTLVAAAHQLGIARLEACSTARLFFLHGTLSYDDAMRLAHDLLTDAVTETFAVFDDLGPADLLAIDVTFLPGVTDPAAENLLRAARIIGIHGLERAATGQRYLLRGSLTDDDLQRLATEVCANPVVQRFSIGQPISAPFVGARPGDGAVETIAVREADDAALQQISSARRLALNLAEMQAIRAYYREEGRDPTDVELEMLAQTWSEHCSHKTFKAAIEYHGPPPGATPDAPPTTQRIDGLLQSYIRAATEHIHKPWVRSAFVDNAGIIAFDDTYDLAFKVETHNHPSALEPFGGANTGVGGVIRDVLGVSARPIANTDVLCFGLPDMPAAQVPEGVLHPTRVADGVVHGIEDYGNKMGIPTVNGAILYDPGYTANPLVFCGCLGLLPHGAHPTAPQPGDLVVVVGGHTGRDGLRGATFSSMEMDQETGEIASTAVQIGHPIHEKQVLEVVLRARDERLYTAITDCGAGGLSSAVGEMGQALGAQVQLADVPLKYPGLRPWEIWLSEAQERMVLAVPPQHWSRLQEICAEQEIDAVCIGTFSDDGRLVLRYGERVVGEIDTGFLHGGLPRRTLTAIWQPGTIGRGEPAFAQPADLGVELLALLANPNVRSKEPVIRRYDHEVQGGTAVKPLVGPRAIGHGDGAVLVPQGTAGPHDGPVRGVALSAGICPSYGALDPYAMAWAALDEAMRNLVALGADPDNVAVLDNFCWGNPNLPDRLGALVRCAQGCYAAALAYGVPFISGKDSLNNEYADADGTRHAIPGTLLISALGAVPNVRQALTSDLKQADNLLYLVGETCGELGGSLYALRHGDAGGTPPQPVADALDRMRALHAAIRAGLVQACHDCSEGGLGVALAEMCIAGRLGAQITTGDQPGHLDRSRDDVTLFCESLCRFVVEVRPADALAFEELLGSVPHACIGSVTDAPQLRIFERSGQEIVSVTIGAMEQAWRPGVRSQETGVIGSQASSIKRQTSSTKRSSPPKVLILHATGTNRDRDAALACELAGGAPEIVHVNQLLAGTRRLDDYGMLVVPGGFSYGDDLGAGKLWAVYLRELLGEALAHFIADGRPVLGICNGFQTLVKAGLLPGTEVRGQESGVRSQRSEDPTHHASHITHHASRITSPSSPPVTLTYNKSGHFECRWVYLQPEPRSPCLFTQGLEAPIFCPVAHGEGRLAARDAATLEALEAKGLVALRYVTAAGEPAAYPDNPNGSELNIAGLCNPQGNLLGLMPHPENYIFPWQHPRGTAGEWATNGLRLFENGIRFA